MLAATLQCWNSTSGHALASSLPDFPGSAMPQLAPTRHGVVLCCPAMAGYKHAGACCMPCYDPFCGPELLLQGCNVARSKMQSMLSREP